MSHKIHETLVNFINVPFKYGNDYFEILGRHISKSAKSEFEIRDFQRSVFVPGFHVNRSLRAVMRLFHDLPKPMHFPRTPDAYYSTAEHNAVLHRILWPMNSLKFCGLAPKTKNEQIILVHFHPIVVIIFDWFIVFSPCEYVRNKSTHSFSCSIDRIFRPLVVVRAFSSFHFFSAAHFLLAGARLFLNILL